MNIIMLNVLIAIISGTYDKVVGAEKNVSVHETITQLSKFFSNEQYLTKNKEEEFKNKCRKGRLLMIEYETG